VAPTGAMANSECTRRPLGAGVGEFEAVGSVAPSLLGVVTRRASGFAGTARATAGRR